MPEKYYLAVDPGETSGYAIFSVEGDIVEMGQFKQAEQNAWIRDHITEDCIALIIEDYKNYASHKQKRWSRNQTSKNIGAFEMACFMFNVTVILQMANIKAIGYKWAGLGAAPSNHSISHQYDAVVHGVYWLISTGKVPMNKYVKEKEPKTDV